MGCRTHGREELNGLKVRCGGKVFQAAKGVFSKIAW